VNKDHGGDAGNDWQKGLEIRVVRGYKLSKLSKLAKFAPEEGYRYAFIKTKRVCATSKQII
jgi:hypothetical protein